MFRVGGTRDRVSISPPGKVLCLLIIRIPAMTPAMHTDMPGWRAKSLDVGLFSAFFALQHLQTCKKIQNEIGQLHDLGQFASLEDTQCLVLPALASLPRREPARRAAPRGQPCMGPHSPWPHGAGWDLSPRPATRHFAGGTGGPPCSSWAGVGRSSSQEHECPLGKKPFLPGLEALDFFF